MSELGAVSSTDEVSSGSQGFVHRALVYSSQEDFLAATVPFAQTGLDLDERVFAAVSGPNRAALADALGDGAELVDMHSADAWYGAPGRTLAAYRRYVHEQPARRVRVIGEPVWADRSPAEEREWVRYEAALNVVMARSSASILCPYDARALSPRVLGSAACTHPEVVSGDEAAASGRFDESALFLAPSKTELEAPAGHAVDLRYAGSSAELRRFIVRRSSGAGLSRERTTDLLTSVTEIATNAWLHGDPPIEVRTWCTRDRFVCEVADGGAGIQDPLAGYREPGLLAEGGWGLWISRQLCDLVEIRSGPSKAVVRISMSSS